MKNWQIEGKVSFKDKDFTTEKLIDILLANRKVTTKEKKLFLNPDLSKLTSGFVKINKKDLKKSFLRIKKAIKSKEKIIIYGDYDVDGICATAILWETLNFLKADVMPYIPSRFDEGYGLSKEGIDNILKNQKVDLIITVDNGIVAKDAVDYATKKGIDVIITDHHVSEKTLPKAFSILHTTLLCGAGISYLFSKEILEQKANLDDNHLELATLATIADLVPLNFANRIIVHFGIKRLQKTDRVGLLALLKKAGIKKQDLGVYEIGHVIAPRINAMGRLSSAMDSLRLICTKDKNRAESLSNLLTNTNLERQQMTFESLEYAKNKVNKKELKNLIFIADDSFKEGIVGLIAGRMVEEFYRPSIIISKGKIYSKASARSIAGFNIVEFLREAKDLLVDVGGHPMAAGFTVETAKIPLLEKKLFEISKKLIKKDHFEKVLRIDCELDSKYVNSQIYKTLQILAPFGMANPEPTFLTKNLTVENLRLVGNDGKHLKIKLSSNGKSFEGIAFGMGAKNDFKIGESVDMVYVLDENVWNGNKTLQLKIKDIRKS